MGPQGAPGPEGPAGPAGPGGVDPNFLIVTRAASVVDDENPPPPNQQRNIVYFDSIERAAPVVPPASLPFITYQASTGLFRINEPGTYLFMAQGRANFHSSATEAQKVVELHLLSNGQTLDVVAGAMHIAGDQFATGHWVLKLGSNNVPYNLQVGFVPSNSFTKFDTFGSMKFSVLKLN